MNIRSSLSVASSLCTAAFRTVLARDGSARYLYAITDAVEHPDCGDIGIDGAAVYAASQGPVAAVVSDITDKRIQPERSKLCAPCKGQGIA